MLFLHKCMEFAAEKWENTAKIVFDFNFKGGVKKCDFNGSQLYKFCT